MSKRLKESVLFTLTLALLALLPSCGGDSTEGITGIPFQESEDGFWGMITPDGEVIFSEEFKEKPTAAKEGMFMVKNEDGLWEIYRAEKKPVKVGTEYVSATAFTNGHALVAERNKPVSLIDKEGKTVKTLDKIGGKDVTRVYAFQHGRAVYYTDDGGKGVMDEDGKCVIAPGKYCGFYYCSDGKIVAIDNKYKKAAEADSVQGLKWSILDRDGKQLFEISGAKYCKIGFFQEGMLPVCVEKDGEKMWGIINDKQETVVTPNAKYKNITQIRDGRFIYYNGSQWGMSDLKGETLIRAKYDMLAFDTDGLLVAVTKDYKEVKFVDYEDNAIGKDTYTMLGALFSDLDNQHALVTVSDTQWALIDRKGEQLEKLPDMVNVSMETGDNYVESDYVDIAGLLAALNITERGIDGIDFNTAPQTAVAKLADRLNDRTTPYHYDYTQSLTYTKEVKNAKSTISVNYPGYLSRQTYKTKYVVDFSYGGYQWGHNENVPTGYVWNAIKPASFSASFDGDGKLRGKLRLVYNSLSTRFKAYGRTVKENNSAVVVALRNGKTAFVRMTSEDVKALWGDINANEIDIDRFKDAKEGGGKADDYGDLDLTEAADSAVCDPAADSVACEW